MTNKNNFNTMNTCMEENHEQKDSDYTFCKFEYSDMVLIAIWWKNHIVRIDMKQDNEFYLYQF